ncbi:Protein of unknown function DUF3367 [Pseudofrankia inefficax]|uniref:Uncharacterized protein n=2 Tax=Pseudofrankia inefficax (strain DSM 45817 / CECT 9037 / DDB 130130 / EuI1c) TaxID=298654 RepID=E3J5M0_PSEI1|nr:Protein of unknown function DUF3367 [Pseudofrankia inefficax]
MVTRSRRRAAVAEGVCSVGLDLDRVPVSVVIPAFNESRRLPSSLPVLSAALQRFHLPDAEVIVVDDGSLDDTARIAADLLRDVPNSRVIRLPRNRGKGAAVRAGVAAAAGEAIVFMDADLASDVADLPALLAALDHAEVALGSRRLGGGAERSAKRRLGSWVFHQVTRMFIPLDLADTQCGFKAFRHTEAKVIFGLSQVAGFAFDIEVLAIARSLGYRIAEVPVRWTEQPHGTFNALRHTPAMLADVVRARRNVHRAVRQAGLATAGPPRLVRPRGELSGFAKAHEVALAQATAGPLGKPHTGGLVERPSPTRRPGLGVDVASRVEPSTRRLRDRPDQAGRPPPDEPNPTNSRRPASGRSGPSARRTGPPGDASPAGLPARTSLLHLLWIALGYATLFLLQAPGKLTADTKIELAAAPTRFLADATHLWNSGSGFGSIQNQPWGYLFPMGPFFLAGHVLAIPPWITQRLWMALVLTVATWGVVRLADTLGIGRPASRLLGGLGYALSPMFLGKIGSTSAALAGAAMLPWMLVPLLRALRPAAPADLLGSPAPADPRLSPRRAAALSGLAVLGTGGVNASVTAAAMLGPVVLLALAGGGRRAWALRCWWLLAALLATAWWAVGLLALGRYGLNFLPFTESVNTATSAASVNETLRGTADWMAYLRLPTAWLPAAADYATSWVAVVGSVAAAALSLWGLARRDLPARRLLVVMFGVGVVVTATAYPGSLGSPVGADVRDLLTGPLSPLRNVFKFQPVVHLPMALGLTHALACAGDRLRRGEFALADRLTGPRRAAAAGAVVLTVAALVAGSTPMLNGDALQPKPFAQVPGYWTQAADWLGANPEGGRTLLLPGAPFGDYRWGRPLDEPMQWLSSTPWGVRNLIPLGSVGITRWLDAVEDALSRGDGAGLAAALARAGVGQIVVRNDLAADAWDTPPSTSEIHRALAASGLREAATFGPAVAAHLGTTELSVPVARRPAVGKVPALEVWTVPGGASLVQAYSAADALVVAGGPEATLQLAAHGLLPADRAVVLADDLTGPGEVSTAGGVVAPSADTVPASQVLTPTTGLAVTDTLDRRDYIFGRVHASASYLLGPDEDVAGSVTPPHDWTDRPPAGHQTVGGYLDGKSVTASSYGYALRAAPELGPASAVDGLPYSWWMARADPKTGTEGAWLRVDVGTPVAVPYLQVQLLAESARRSVPQVVRVTTANGSVDTRVTRTEQAQRLAVPPGKSSWYQVTLLRVAPNGGTALGAGIRELTVPGQSFQHYAQVPSDATGLLAGTTGGSTAFAFDRARSDILAPFSASEEPAIARRFETSRPTRLTLTGTATLAPLQTGTQPQGDRRVLFDCGQGPEVRIDGTTYQLRVEGRSGDIAAARPMRVTLCTPDGSVALPAGQHVLTVAPAAAPTVFVDTLSLASPAPSQPASTQRSTTVGRWTAERRTVTVGPGQQAFLAVRENANRSWTATLGGVRLTPIRLDGWQQGWIVPAGAGGTVVLENRPGQTYRTGLVVGFVLVAVLLAVALVPGRRRRRHRSSRLDGGARLAAGTRWWDRLPDWWVAMLAGTVAVALVAGPVAVVVPALAVVARRWPGLMPWAAAAAMTAAGVAMLATPDGTPREGVGAFGGFAQAAGATALAAVLVALCPVRDSRPGSRAGGP